MAHVVNWDRSNRRPNQGNQHPRFGFPHNCSLEVANSCAPTYTQLSAAGELWPCPDGDDPDLPLWPQDCVAGATTSAPSRTCAASSLNASHPCCCPARGCYTAARFNTIIGVCRGGSCGPSVCGGGRGEKRPTAPSCGPQGFPGYCESLRTIPPYNRGNDNCTGKEVPCCRGSDLTPLLPWFERGSKARLNYWAAFDFEPASRQWVMQDESSFNTDGSRPVFDLLKPYGGLSVEDAWLAPQPGGSASWGLGYYPAGVRGVGKASAGRDGGAAMFVLSTEEWFGATWYMLNQLTLDRGPDVKMPVTDCSVTNNNCWAAGNAGEMDFLEPGFGGGRGSTISLETDYRASFATQNNQMGRLWPGGVNTGGWTSNNYLLTPPIDAPEPVVYVAVVDRVGNYVYRIPAADVERVWPGISRKTINATLRAAPTEVPGSINPCVDGYCMTFTSNCQATTSQDAHTQGCALGRPTDGFCGNWFASMGETGQQLFPNASCTKDVRGGVEMPWCVEMVR